LGKLQTATKDKSVSDLARGLLGEYLVGTDYCVNAVAILLNFPKNILDTWGMEGYKAACRAIYG